MVFQKKAIGKHGGKSILKPTEELLFGLHYYAIEDGKTLYLSTKPLTWIQVDYWEKEQGIQGKRFVSNSTIVVNYNKKKVEKEIGE